MLHKNLIGRNPSHHDYKVTGEFAEKTDRELANFCDDCADYFGYEVMRFSGYAFVRIWVD